MTHNINKLEEQINQLRKITDHDIREYPIGVIVDKFLQGLEEDQAELYIPDYQREFIWSKDQQSRFIESIFLNLPIPYLFVSDTNENNDGRLEIVDGSQRIRTLVAFVTNELCLSNLKKITYANGIKFRDLTKPRQMRFLRQTLRMIELTEQADEEARREIFDRLNTGGTKLNPMEQRFGSLDSPLMDLIDTLVNTYKKPQSLLRVLCPISQSKEDRREYHELLLRFFAYSDNYLNFNHDVDDFLVNYIKEINKLDNIQQKEKLNTLKNEFEYMLEKANSIYSPFGFAKTPTAKSTPRIRFESLAVGLNLALREKPNLHKPLDMTWLDLKSNTDLSKEFIKHTRSDASNSRIKVKDRIEFVKNILLGN